MIAALAIGAVVGFAIAVCLSLAALDDRHARKLAELDARFAAELVAERRERAAPLIAWLNDLDREMDSGLPFDERWARVEAVLARPPTAEYVTAVAFTTPEVPARFVGLP